MVGGGENVVLCSCQAKCMTCRNHSTLQYSFFVLAIFFALFIPAPDSCAQENRATPRDVTAAVLSDFPPLYILDNEGKPAGFAIDILNRVAAKTGLSVHYLIVENWAAAMEAVRTGEADFIPGIGISEIRSAEFLFSDNQVSIKKLAFFQNVLFRHFNKEIKCLFWCVFPLYFNFKFSPFLLVDKINFFPRK